MAEEPGADRRRAQDLRPDRRQRFRDPLPFLSQLRQQLFWEGDRSPTTCGIAVGCFADPDFPAPTSSGWEESMHQWLGLPPDTAHFPAIALLKEWRRERR